ncbi:PadR family transcriptional regulator [Saliphagus sp. LR7]|uniref:PadR family transcriptional regulator n=1 Tax=Saliphagus sp. LR7 TaxID=2282654 RepID=UPI000DF7828C|nr:PadR family transcriptional regulator [Saliphagus sp. LR7]
MDNLTGFQRDLLYVIAGFDRPSGASIRSEIGKYYQSEINHGRLYPNLDTLVADGLVEKGEIDRRTNSYILTDAGDTAIRERREWEIQYLSADVRESPDPQPC